MTEPKDIFLDKDLRGGGFYELAVQVCSSIDNNPIKLYTDYIWTLENIEGPFDEHFNTIQTDINTFLYRGIIRLENYVIPFMTYNIREEPIETGFNWFDLCFHTAAIEKVFGRQYTTWTEKQNVPKELANFFFRTMKQLFKIHPFLLAMCDYETSGQYYYDDLKKNLSNNNWTNTKFYIGQANYEQIDLENKKYVTLVESI